MDIITSEDLVNRAIGLSEGIGYIDVIKLAKNLGVDVFLATNANEDYSAHIEKDPETNQYNILVNPAHPIERQRFSIAHELAHFVLHKDKLDQEGKLNREHDERANKTEEDKADFLAAEILMPTSLVEKLAADMHLDKKIKITKNIIEKIAGYFKVSRTVAAIKLRELKYFVPFTSFT